MTLTDEAVNRIIGMFLLIIWFGGGAMGFFISQWLENHKRTIVRDMKWELDRMDKSRDYWMEQCEHIANKMQNYKKRKDDESDEDAIIRYREALDNIEITAALDVRNDRDTLVEKLEGVQETARKALV